MKCVQKGQFFGVCGKGVSESQETALRYQKLGAESNIKQGDRHVEVSHKYTYGEDILG